MATVTHQESGRSSLPVFPTPLSWAEKYLNRSVEVDMGFLKVPAGLKGARERGREGRGLICKAVLPGVLLLLGGHVEVEVKLPAPLGIAGQGRHHPFAGGARRLEQPYCRHTSGQLLGEVTKRRSIYLSSGSTETRHVTPRGCLGLGPASLGLHPLPPQHVPPCPSPQSDG